MSLPISLCSGSKSKLAELRLLLPGDDLELLEVEYPAEDGATYFDNARIKAEHGRRIGPSGRYMLADDSGIEVAALGGGPGVHTARWAEGRHVEKLLAALAGAQDRTARYVCELVCLAPNGAELRTTGVLDGSISRLPAGSGGFGFDPVFVPSGLDHTVSELGDSWKAGHSHRALAAAALRPQLEDAARATS